MSQLSTEHTQLRIEHRWLLDGSVVLEPLGTLDTVSYVLMRDAIIKEAVGEPRLIVVDADQLWVPAQSAWAVFTSARWHIATWPDVPLALSATDETVRSAIWRSGVTRYVPCYPDVDSAVADPRSTSFVRRANVTLNDSTSAGVVARAAIRDSLETWDMAAFIDIGCAVGTHLVEMVAPIEESAILRIESGTDKVTVTIEEPSTRLRVRDEGPTGTDQTSDMGVLSSICRDWGTLPDSTGHRVLWAVCGRENLV